MPLSEYVLEQLERLDAAISDQSSESITALRSAKMPTGTLDGAFARYRDVLAQYKINDFDDYSDEELEFEMPLVSGFKFAGVDGFYKGWQADLPAATEQHTPLGSDEYNYFFVVPNPRDPKDPLIHVIDHEEQNEPPDEWFDLTVGMLLGILQTG